MTSHEVVYSVNYVKLSLKNLQYYAVVNFADFHCSSWELTANFSVTCDKINIIANNYVQLCTNSGHSIVCQRVLPRGAKLSQ